MRRMALIASAIQAAHISDRGFRPLGLHLQGRDQGVLGLDHEPVAPAFNADTNGVLRLHADAPLPSMPSRQVKPSKGREPPHMNKAEGCERAEFYGVGPKPVDGGRAFALGFGAGFGLGVAAVSMLSATASGLACLPMIAAATGGSIL